MKLCTFPDCFRRHKALGLCEPHYQQQRRGTELHPLRDVARPTELDSATLEALASNNVQITPDGTLIVGPGWRFQTVEISADGDRTLCVEW